MDSLVNLWISLTHILQKKATKLNLIASWKQKDVCSLFMENEEYIIQVIGFFPPFTLRKQSNVILLTFNQNIWCETQSFQLRKGELALIPFEFILCAASWTRFLCLAYLMQWAAVSTQLVAMRVPPQVWRHLPLELYWREAWDQGTSKAQSFLLIFHPRACPQNTTCWWLVRFPTPGHRKVFPPSPSSKAWFLKYILFK